MASSVVALVRKRARDPRTRTDQSDVVGTTLHAPVRPEVIVTAERELQVQLPRFLRDLYLLVGNGGFGPGYGLMGVNRGFRDDLGQTIVDLYRSFAAEDPSEPGWRWPPQLLPICHFGCAIYSCVDCTTPNGAVLVWDPNMHEHGSDPLSAIRPIRSSLESWFESWANGRDLWSEMFPDAAADENSK